MKRTLAGFFAMAALVIGAGSALAAPSPLPGSPDDTTIKACADYSTGNVGSKSDGLYDPVTGALSFRIVLADNMCKNLTYSFFAFAGTSVGGSLVFQDARPGDPSTNIYTLSATIINPPSNVCVYATTTKSNGTLLDRAPGEDPTTCYVVPTSGASGGGAFH